MCRRGKAAGTYPAPLRLNATNPRRWSSHRLRHRPRTRRTSERLAHAFDPPASKCRSRPVAEVSGRALPDLVTALTYHSGRYSLPAPPPWTTTNGGTVCPQFARLLMVAAKRLGDGPAWRPFSQPCTEVWERLGRLAIFGGFARLPLGGVSPLGLPPQEPGGPLRRSEPPAVLWPGCADSKRGYIASFSVAAIAMAADSSNPVLRPEPREGPGAVCRHTRLVGISARPDPLEQEELADPGRDRAAALGRG